MIKSSRLEHVFGPLVGQRVCFVRTPIDNPGDRLVDLATRQLLDEFKIDWHESDVPPQGTSDTILMFGGGTVGVDVAEDAMKLREAAAKSGSPWYVLTSTAYKEESSLASARTVFVRDRESARLISNATLAPDIALAYKPPRVPAPTNPAKLYLRKQGAGLWRNAMNFTDPREWISDAQEYVEFAGSHRLIVTDILHLAISCIVAGRRPVLLPTGSHKNRGIYESYLHEFADWADSPHDVFPSIDLGTQR